MLQRFGNLLDIADDRINWQACPLQLPQSAIGSVSHNKKRSISFDAKMKNPQNS